MTADDFRKLALALPEASESSHMAHPDFRVRNKIFATLHHQPGCAMVKLTPAQQREFVKKHPTMFEPVTGGWGKRGATTIILPATESLVAKKALLTAWRNTAPKGLSM